MRTWTKKEEDWFIKNYPVKGKKYCMEHLNRTDGSMRHKAYQLKLVSKFRNNPESNYNRGSGWRGKKRPEHSKYLKKNHPLKGKHHSQATKDKLSAIMQANPMSHPYSRSKAAWHTIGGKRCYFRSLWEVDYAIYLEFLLKNKEIKSWEYEPDTFWFEKIRRGVRSYKPDFKIQNKNGDIEYHEVKGWMDNKSKTKIKRMAKYHPDVKLIIIDGDAIKEIRKYSKMLKL